MGGGSTTSSGKTSIEGCVCVEVNKGGNVGHSSRMKEVAILKNAREGKVKERGVDDSREDECKELDATIVLF